MPPRKRAAEDAAEPVAKRRSTRQAAAAVAATATTSVVETEKEKKKPTQTLDTVQPKKGAAKKGTVKVAKEKKSEEEAKPIKLASKKTAPKDDEKKKAKPAVKRGTKSRAKDEEEEEVPDASEEVKPKSSKDKKASSSSTGSRAASEDPDVDSIPTTNPEAPRHDGEWYWLMKAEPETRYENGIDVRFSIDDLRAKEKPEGWDGIRAYAARNNMRNMNAGDKAFFYHSNCKEPGIAGIMEIVKEFSEDKSARRPGTPYYDPQSTRENPRWSLVHVEFRKKFAVPITLKELRELGKSGGPLESMQMLKQSRLSVTRVSGDEWEALCEIADEKAKEAGVEHVVTKLTK
ncbi:Thymocyte nuclear protein 1 [Cladobotryum mycophilum]|uniref:Thymocyte nuclear protein 1 n=1 Tax=Cladobotryum mycophilum TaxID=491253 RepID=A0ABR0S4H9_9HYPO